MSAPFKQGLSYFSHDTDMSDDPKMEYLEAAHGLAGYAVFIKLLEKIYRNGYFTNWDERDICIFAKKNNIEIEKCHEIVFDCITENLFDDDLFNKYKILTSHGIQTRYLKSCERRKNITLILEYLNVDTKWINDNINSVNVIIKKINGEIYSINVAESKEKKSKVKKSNNIFDENSPQFKLANLFLQKILLNLPKFKQPNLQSWTKEIDLMIRADNRKPEEIEQVIIWCQSNAFWHANILSTKKLRNQFDQLAAQMNRESKQGNNGLKPAVVKPDYSKMV